MAQSTFSAPTPSSEMTPAPMAASGPSRADKYYFAPKREHIEGAGANDKFYSYKDSAWVPRSALPDDAQIILVTHCHDMAGGPCKTLEEACIKNAEYLRAQIEAEQDSSSGGGGGGSAGGLTLEEVKALIAEAVSAHGTDSTAHAATITAAVSAAVSAAISSHSADTSAHVEAIKPLIVTAVSEHSTDPTAHASAISTAIGTHNTDPTAHPDIREAITSGGGGGGDTPVDPPVDPVAPPSAPVITMADRLPIGRAASIGLAATPADTASITKFSVTINDGTPVDVAATANAATYSHTPAGTAGDTVTVKATATDSFDAISTEATATATLYDYTYPIYWIHNDGSGNMVLYRSDDKALTFNAINTPAGCVLKYNSGCTAPDRQTVYICGEDAEDRLCVYKSTDQGETWENILTRDSPASLHCMAAPSENHFLLNCIKSTSPTVRVVYMTLDGGTTWTESNSTFNFSNIVMGNNRLFAYALGTTGTYYYSDDLGATWSYYTFAAGTAAPAGICPIPDTEGTVCMLMTDGKTYVTSDNGANWTTYTSSQVNASDIVYVEGGKLLKSARPSASTYNHTSIYKSENYGQTWTLVKALGIGSIVRIYKMPDGTLIAGGDKGKLSRSTDGGVTWSAAQATNTTISGVYLF